MSKVSVFKVLNVTSNLQEITEIKNGKESFQNPDNVLAKKCCEILFESANDSESWAYVLQASVTIAANVIVNLEKPHLEKGLPSPVDVLKEFNELLDRSVYKGRNVLLNAPTERREESKS